MIIGEIVKKEDLKTLDLAFIDRIRKVEEKPENIFIHVYKILEDEIADIARQIRLNIIKEKKEFKDIAVILNNAEIYEKEIKRVFNKYNIPVHINIEKPLNTNNIVKYLIYLLDILNGEYDSEKIISFLKLRIF